MTGPALQMRLSPALEGGEAAFSPQSLLPLSKLRKDELLAQGWRNLLLGGEKGQH